MFKLSLIACLCIGASLGAGDNWWHHTSVYQIYPRSFQDSNGDGTGDLKGIESRLDYFVDMGIETIWLSPIYKSPQKDFGYDISDFKDIDPTYGTIQDFQSLLAAAHDRNLKILLDFVPNHSSDEHEWFVKSVAREDPYTDYYVWVDPKGYDSDGKPIPPNNWVSVFRGSAWEYNEQRGQFYLHQFVAGQPDLNYRNPAVVTEMRQVLEFWLDLGVDGFRMDAVAFIWEDEQLLDEPLSGFTDDPNDYGYLNHIYTNNLQGTRDVLKSFYELIKSYTSIDGHDRLDMVEVYLPNEAAAEYYQCSDFPFNFQFIFYDSNVNADGIKFNIENWIANLPEGGKANWVLGNHDQWRIGSRVRPELMNAFNLLTLTLPGVSITYQGEEIGMTNADISWEDTVDPSGCNCGPDRYDQIGCSRDPERTPMQWSGTEKNAGFSSADKTWLPINPNYATINVETESADQNSYLSFYKQVMQVRKSDPAFDVGQVIAVTQNNVLAFSRSFDPSFYPTYVTAINFNTEATKVDFSGQLATLIDTGLLIASTLGSNSAFAPGDTINLADLTLQANEGILVYLFDLK